MVIHSVHRFRQEWTGRVMDHNGPLGLDFDECVDVPNTWAAEIGIPASFGNAKDLDYSSSSVWIPNLPFNRPLPGDIVIFQGRPYAPEFGHTGVALHGCTNARLRMFWQNDPDGSPCHVAVVDYTGCKGWWHPKVLGPKGA